MGIRLRHEADHGTFIVPLLLLAVPPLGEHGSPERDLRKTRFIFRPSRGMRQSRRRNVDWELKPFHLRKSHGWYVGLRRKLDERTLLLYARTDARIDLQAQRTRPELGSGSQRSW